MAAPPTGHPVTVIVGTVWQFQFQPPPPTRLTVDVVITWAVISLARIIFGVMYFTDCPQQPNIPIYLIGFVLVPLLLISLMVLPCEDDSAPLRERLRGFRDCVQGLLGLFIVIWILLGDVWVFSIYQPNYNPSAADGLYCNETLYTFAFWNAVLETFGLGVVLFRFCKGLMCFVITSPAPGHADFYRNV